jgi:DNA-binding NarL/FixJ family response regulator
MGTKRKYAILVIDEHPIWRQGIACLVNNEPDLEVCGQADCLSANLVVARNPDLVIVDLADGEPHGVGVIRQVAAKYPGASILVHSFNDEHLHAERVIRAGARGYLMKQESGDALITAIRDVLAGRVYLSESMREMLLSRVLSAQTGRGHPNLGSLSDREMQVFTLLGDGKGPREIAQKMKVSVKTIDAYRAHIKRKLMLRNGSELMRLAVLHSQRYPRSSRHLMELETPGNPAKRPGRT